MKEPTCILVVNTAYVFTEPLKTMAYLLTEYLKNREYQLVLALGDAFKAKVNGTVSKNFLGA